MFARAILPNQHGPYYTTGKVYRITQFTGVRSLDFIDDTGYNRLGYVSWFDINDESSFVPFTPKPDNRKLSERIKD